jgi:mannosyl-oligosaccharide alpha-1,2-mannosidase
MSFYNNSLGIGLRPKKEKNYWKAVQNNRDQDLPLYKDKPNTQPRRKDKKAMAFKGVILLIAFYVCYYIGWFLKHEAKINTAFEKDMTDWKFAQSEVKRVFKETWSHYEQDAWGKDVYNPISRKGKNMGPKPLGWIIVDSLDTMLLMGLDEEFKTASAWVENELTYDFDYEVNVFETTIRMLGGLLSAYYLSKNDMFLDKAVDLGDRLIGAFDTPTGLPYSSVNLHTRKGVKNHVDGGASSTAEVSTLQLEFKYLAKLTGESLYWEKVEHIMKVLDDNHALDGLVPIYVNPDSGKYQGRLIRLGSRGDSYYEYLLKQYLQTEEGEAIYNEMYHESVRGMKDHMLLRSQPHGLAFLGELENGVGGPLSSKMDHLVCFIGGLFALGATEGQTLQKARKSSSWNSLKEDDLMLAKDITHTCYEMYAQTATGLSPEIVVFNTKEGSTEDFIIKPLDKHNLQRPETVESLFILYRITGDPLYRKWGWEIFKSFEKYTKTTDGSYTSLDDVTHIPPKQRDNMESFWLSETLKYLYLLFDDSNLTPLDQVVFNTEAHPFPKFSMNPLFKTSWTRSKALPMADKIEEVKKANVRKPVDEGVHEKEPVKEQDKKQTQKQVNEPVKPEFRVVDAPKAAQPAKPAQAQLEEIKQSIEDDKTEKVLKDDELANRALKQKLQDDKDINEILEDLVELS